MFKKIHLSDHVYYIINLLSYLPSPEAALFRAANAFPGYVVRASPTCSSRIRHRNASTEKAWEDAAQGPGNQVMSIVKCITLSKANTESKMNDETGTALFAS